MYEMGDELTCDGCGEQGALGDEIFLYDLPTGPEYLSPLCLTCGPEENYAELAEMREGR